MEDRDLFFGWSTGWSSLGALSSDAARQLDVLGRNGYALGVDGAHVRIFKETH